MNDREKTISAYDQAAEQYGAEKNAHFWIEEYPRFTRLLKGRKILDIGCGAGRDAIVFTRDGFVYTGIDASEGMLKVATQVAPKGTYKKMDFDMLEFPDNAFDGFWAAAAFLHVPKAQIQRPLQDAKRVIKPGGVGFVSLKERNGISEGLIEEKKRWGGVARYFAFYEQQEFAVHLQEAGFEILSQSKHIEDDERKTVWLCYFVRKI